MLLVCFRKVGKTYLANKYKDRVNDLDSDKYISSDNTEDGWPINYIEAIKQSEINFDLTLIPYMTDVVLCLDALNIEYTLVYPNTELERYKEFWKFYSVFEASTKPKIILQNDNYLEQGLASIFDWIKLEESDDSKQLIISEDDSIAVSSSNKLTLDKLVDDNVQITESDIREFKATQNKLKIGLILQAKTSLNRILKMSTMLDKLYDELLDRVDNSLKTTDTASLMYTTEYISKALNETNQFIMSLVNNEKIQNFFIVDNSSVVNIGNDRVDISKRERIRKAVEVVVDNLDYFASGEFDKIQNPNIIDVSEEKDNADKTT